MYIRYSRSRTLLIIQQGLHITDGCLWLSPYTIIVFICQLSTNINVINLSYVRKLYKANRSCMVFIWGFECLCLYMFIFTYMSQWMHKQYLDLSFCYYTPSYSYKSLPEHKWCALTLWCVPALLQTYMNVCEPHTHMPA